MDSTFYFDPVKALRDLCTLVGNRDHTDKELLLTPTLCGDITNRFLFLGSFHKGLVKVQKP